MSLFDNQRNGSALGHLAVGALHNVEETTTPGLQIYDFKTLQFCSISSVTTTISAGKTERWQWR